MIESIISKVKGFILNPVEAFQQSKKDDVNEVFIYFGVLLVVYSVLVAIMSVIGFGGVMPGGQSIVMVLISSLLGTLILTLVFAVWLHLWVYLLGGKNGIMATIKSVIYASTPELLLGWLPVIGLIFSLWSIVLGILGLRELQDISTSKAVIVYVIAVLIPVILLVMVAAFFIISFMSITETMA